jgi:hypothetical protein
VARTALYREPTVPTPPRATVSLDAASLALTLADGQTRHQALDGCAVMTVDAACHRRFVKMLVVEAARWGTVPPERLSLITPPERGAIAPGAARLPAAPRDAVVLDCEEWDVLARWLCGGGRLGACSVGDLARLAAIASPQFAVVIGEVAASMALEAVWAAVGPLRGGTSLEHALRPLYDAARHSPRAGDALIAALAYAAVRPQVRRGPT